MSDIESGCLLIADISGYTRYLGGVELEHAQDILADLLGGVVANAGAFEIAKLEGDAVFCHAAEGLSGGALIDTIEACYFDFCRRKRNIQQLSSCPCDACHRLDGLDLKFVVHFGSYMVHEVAGHDELVGFDVIVVHRLLKNSIPDELGVQGYALLTNAVADRLGLAEFTNGLTGTTIDAEDIEVEAWVLDLEQRWAEHQRAATVQVADPTIEVTATCRATPAEIWPIMTGAAERPNWVGVSSSVDQQNTRGVPGVGTINHCLHGDGSTTTDEILDWAPFSHVTFRTRTSFGEQLVTYALEPTTHTTTTIHHRYAIDFDAPEPDPALLDGLTTYFRDDVLRLAALVEQRRTGA